MVEPFANRFRPFSSLATRLDGEGREKGCKIGGDFEIIPAAQYTLDGQDGPRGGRYFKHRPPGRYLKYRPLPGSPSAPRRSAAASRPS